MRKWIRKPVLPRCHRPPRPETLRWLRGGLLTSGSEDMLLPRRQRLRAGLGSGGRGWSTSKPSEIPATVELDELKELYKKKKKTLKHDKHKHT